MESHPFLKMVHDQYVHLYKEKWEHLISVCHWHLIKNNFRVVHKEPEEKVKFNLLSFMDQFCSHRRLNISIIKKINADSLPFCTHEKIYL
jgi:hypothetical protein